MEKISYPAPKQDYKVLVRCFTYNQSKYIEETLKGFSIQKTDFPFICIVIDDASTDGEQEVIKGWLNRECEMSKAEIYDIPTSIVMIVPHKTNRSCTFAFYLLKQNLYENSEEKMKHVKPWRERCELEAICEGDDYWTDPYKLQKQTDILGSNNTYGLCYTKAKVYNQKNNCFYDYPIGEKQESFEDLVIGNKIPTLTTLYKIELYEKYVKNIKPETKNWLMGDYPMWLWFSVYSKIIFLEEETSVYRLLENSASHFDNYNKFEKFSSSTRDIRMYFNELYLKSPLLENKINDSYHREIIVFCKRYRKYYDIYNHLKKIKYKTTIEKIKYYIYIIFFIGK